MPWQQVHKQRPISATMRIPPSSSFRPWCSASRFPQIEKKPGKNKKSYIKYRKVWGAEQILAHRLARERCGRMARRRVAERACLKCCARVLHCARATRSAMRLELMPPPTRRLTSASAVSCSAAALPCARNATNAHPPGEKEAHARKQPGKVMAARQNARDACSGQ